MGETAAIEATAVTPVHQWTNGGTRVRILKCVTRGGHGYGGFRWPESGPVQCPRAAADRASALAPTCESGGLFGWPWGTGHGAGREPDYSGRWIVFEADPADVIPVGDDGKVKAVGRCTVIFSGSWWLAWPHVLSGLIAWTQHASRGAASATGESGAASATGGRGAASATGESGAASATGERGIASLTGEDGRVEAGPGGICAVTAERVTWTVHVDAVLVQRWRDEAKGQWITVVFIPAAMGWATGDRVVIERGVPVERDAGKDQEARP